MRIYGAIDKELDRAVPEGADINQRLSSLIDIRNRAGQEESNAGSLQSGIGRIAKLTGAGALPALGAYEGERTEGIPRAIAGGLIGTFTPAALTSPEVQILAARTAPKVVRALPKIGLGLSNAARKK